MLSYTFILPYTLTIIVWPLNPSVAADGQSYVCFTMHLRGTAFSF
jgi:hypothetical protein